MIPHHGTPHPRGNAISECTCRTLGVNNPAVSLVQPHSQRLGTIPSARQTSPGFVSGWACGAFVEGDHEPSVWTARNRVVKGARQTSSKFFEFVRPTTGSAWHLPRTMRSAQDTIKPNPQASRSSAGTWLTHTLRAHVSQRKRRVARVPIERIELGSPLQSEWPQPRRVPVHEISADPREARALSTATKIVTREAARTLVSQARVSGKTVVFTNGCFDLLHIGHVTCLEQAAALGDVLVVAINSDDSVRQLKGPRRPIITALHRARLIAALQCVHYVILFDEPTPCELLDELRPEVLVKGGTTHDVVGEEIVKARGGLVRIVATVVDISTTEIVRRVRGSG